MFKITYNAKVIGKGVDSVIGNVYDFSTRSGVGTGIITLNYVIKPDSTYATLNVSPNNSSGSILHCGSSTI